MIDQKVCDLLNEALLLDPVGITCLMNSCVIVNEEMEKHPNIVVSDFFGGYTLSVLGLLQGLAGTNGKVLAKVLEEGSGRIISFKLVNKEEVGLCF